MSLYTTDLSSQNWDVDYLNWQAGASQGDSCDSPASSYSESSASSPLIGQAPRQAPRPPLSKKKGPDHITRPPNAFLLFRSDFWANEKQKPTPVERDHRDISRIAAHCWRNLDDATRKDYHHRAQRLRDLHRLQYPEYRLTPAPRRPRAPKRKTGAIIAREARCLRIASSIMGSTIVPPQHISILRSSHTPGPEFVQRQQHGNVQFTAQHNPNKTVLHPSELCPPMETRASGLVAPKPVRPTGYVSYPSPLGFHYDPQPLFSTEPCKMTALLNDVSIIPPLPTTTQTGPGFPESDSWGIAFQHVATQQYEYNGIPYQPYQQVQTSPFPTGDVSYIQDPFFAGLF